MKKGGKPKPTKLKLLEGNPGKKPIPQDEPRPQPVEPILAKKSLDRDAETIWDELSPMLGNLGLLTEIDGDNFASVCRIIARIRQIDEVLADPETKLMISWTEMTPSGSERIVVKINPIIPEQRQLMKDLRLYAPEFGMTPRGRVGLSVGSSTKKAPKLEKLID